MNLNNESKTLFIPLYGKALMSKNNVFLHDLKAEEIINTIDYDFKKLKQSKWLSMYMSLRALILDNLCNNYLTNHKDTTVIHLGCGLDSRYLRVKNIYNKWYDIDFKNVIDLRKQFYKENQKYQMISSSVLDYTWLDKIETQENILTIAEGLTMYLSENEIKELLNQISNKFKNVTLMFDAYSKKAVKASKIKNPVKQMNANIKYGFSNPNDFLKLNNNLKYLNTYIIKKDNNNLKKLTRFIFNHLYCGKISQSYYKIYEFLLTNNTNSRDISCEK